MRIPFTNYDIRLSKRGIKVLSNGQLMSFADWRNNIDFRTSTPIMEEVYSTIAGEFGKIDLRHIIENEKKKTFQYANDDLDYIVSERPNPFQTKYDFLFTLAYQREKYGNALAVITRDSEGHATRIDPLNVSDYVFGNGYKIGDTGTILLKIKNTRTGEIGLVEYENVIHLRKNPNNVFYGELFNGFNRNQAFIELVDSGLSSLISELKNNGTLRGIVKIGNSAVGLANKMLADDKAKQSKQEEIVNRIKKTKGGILVLDAGEEWQSLNSPFETTSTKEIDKYIDILLQFNGINKKVVDGTANESEMEVMFNKTIAPIIDQFIAEMNYKIFHKTSITQGHRIEFYRNPFEYVSIVKAIDVAYKSIQDTTRNERRRLIYKLPPVENGDEFVNNKNFEEIKKDIEKDDDEKKGKDNEGK